MDKTMTLRLDDKVHTELTAIARAQGTNLSDLARRTLANLLVQSSTGSEEARAGQAPIPSSLTTVERHQLALLHRILARLDGEADNGGAAEELARAAILENGFAEQYDDVFVAIETEMSRRDTGLVMDVLDMFRSLEWSYERLSLPARNELGAGVEKTVRFRGFDLNHRRESRLLTFARHLIEQGKWESLAKYFDKDHGRGNSHHPMVGMYERMLEEFNPIWHDMIRRGTRDSFELTAAEIRRIADAAVRPANS
ncbi:YfbU family protein [Paenarthrobacter sp. A20]|uniref:YfbU family protein n=1 Tax=Paenarthrobacter sp. A20 TaxID=2817891 RepID=UPI00209FC163|nr:YfbU family protein [Paenarthrobacter sp. A20]MCP1415651.1 uncharacterized protein YfbU (UPF0304 family) [Paenarthrobacter sp. A20]